MAADDIRFQHSQHGDPRTTDMYVETRIVRDSLQQLNVHVVARVIELVAASVAEEMLKRYKPQLVKLAMRNPDLLSHVRKAALEEAAKIVSSRSND